LTTIVSLDPIYAYFDVDERTTLRLQKLVRDKKIKWSTDASLPVMLGLSDEEGFPRRGAINFADNRVDADTGTWRLRGAFENADLTLSPGLFVRIRLPIGEPYRPMLVAEQALSTDQGQKFAYVVDKNNKVDYRRVKVGRAHEFLVHFDDQDKTKPPKLTPLSGNRPSGEPSSDGKKKDKVVILRVIAAGLAPGEKVVVSGLQRVRPGVEVTTKVVPMANITEGDTDRETGRQGDKETRRRGQTGRRKWETSRNEQEDSDAS